MIRCERVSFGYPGREAVFHELDWRVQRGCSWSVVGASGTGKTTLLYLLAGLLRPSEGRVVVDGSPVVRPRPRTGLILQHLGLMPWATAQANVELGLRIRRFYGPDGRHAPSGDRISRAEVHRRATRWLLRMKLDDYLDRHPAQLSGGQKQRVAIARTLALEPDVLLMDEPFAALDAPVRRSFQDLLLDLEHETGHTRIVVTHDTEEAAYLGRMILVLHTSGEVAVVQNPLSGTPGFRDTGAFAEQCRHLLTLVGQS